MSNVSGALRSLLEPVLPFFEQETITEIYTNQNNYWVEDFTKGRYNTEIPIKDDTVKAIINACAGKANKILENFLQANIPELNSRFQGQHDGKVTSTPSFVFRKRAKQMVTLEDYLEQGRISQKYYDYICQAILEHKNIVVSGGTGSGKTTLVQAVLLKCSELTPKDRIGLLEDTPEIKRTFEDGYDFHTHEDYKDPTKTISMQRLVKESLRMSPDRLVIGEVRDQSAFDVVKSWNTGHDGGLCTVHANNSLLTLIRFEELIREGYPIGDFRPLIASAINIVILIAKKGKNGVSRSVTNIMEVEGFDYEAGKNGKYILQEVVDNETH